MTRETLSESLKNHYDRLRQHGWITSGEDFMCDGEHCLECPLNGNRCISEVMK